MFIGFTKFDSDVLLKGSEPNPNVAREDTGENNTETNGHNCKSINDSDITIESTPTQESSIGYLRERGSDTADASFSKESLNNENANMQNIHTRYTKWSGATQVNGYENSSTDDTSPYSVQEKHIFPEVTLSDTKSESVGVDSNASVVTVESKTEVPYLSFSAFKF